MMLFILVLLSVPMIPQNSYLIYQSIITDERIREMNFGLLEGQKIDEIPEEYKKAYHDLWCHLKYPMVFQKGKPMMKLKKELKTS